MKFHIWTIGCQMNKSESHDIHDYLESRGMLSTDRLNEADLVVLNTCVVRQHAEDKIKSTLGYLKRLKDRKPWLLLATTGCFVSKDVNSLLRKYPQIDLFFPPGDLKVFKDWLEQSEILIGYGQTHLEHDISSAVSAYIPIMQGCDNYCSYCIVPFRRGREKSGPPIEIIQKAREHVARGAREIVLLGQNVNSYGKGLSPEPALADLLEQLNSIKGLYRIRFLTNHPKDMDRRLITMMASLDKVCHHICLPLQSGDDEILARMNRKYTYTDYTSLVAELRVAMPDISLSTDIIVGFPTETDEQFDNTYNAIKNIRFDSVHVACYSPRPQTKASVDFPDDIPPEIKQKRLHKVEELQKSVLAETNGKLVNHDICVLIEGQKKGKWFGRSESDKLVFISSDDNLLGQLIKVTIDSASPWALQGHLTSDQNI